jgi:hypothetical protein
VTAGFAIPGLDLAGHEVAVFELAGVSGVGDSDLPRTGLRLEQNHPNPFNPSTTIRYSLPARSHVRLAVYDLAGREMAVIRDDMQAAGAHEERWSGIDRAGQPLGTGVYFLRLEAGGEARTAKITLMK